MLGVPHKSFKALFPIKHGRAHATSHVEAGLLCWGAKAVAPHSNTLAWKIPWMEEPGRLRSTGSLRVGHD